MIATLALATLSALSPVSDVPIEPATAVAECVTEDQTEGICYWDASEHGNGEGRDFINVYGHTYYL